MAIHARSTTASEEGAYIDRQRRRALEARIEEMIALIDGLDGDPDREEGGDDELSLGWAGTLSGSGIDLSSSPGDRELDVADEPHDVDDEGDLEPDAEDEPTLGWPNNVGKGAVTLTTGCPYQAGGLDGESEPNLRSIHGGSNVQAG